MTPELVWVTLAAGVGTYAIRASFMSQAHRVVALPPTVEIALAHIPAAALAALVASGVMRPGGVWDPWSHRVLAAAVAIAVARWRPGNLALPLVAGMAVATLVINAA